MNDSHQGWLSIREASEKSGLPAATIRYYDQQFEDYLGVARGPGRRRLFGPDSLEKLENIKRLLKDEGLSLRQARQRLLGGEWEPVPAGPGAAAQMSGQVESLANRVGILESQVRELKAIQGRTLALLENLAKR